MRALACWGGINVHGLTTPQNAGDVEALRGVLGAPSLQLLAGSYGTQLALALARRHPASVAAMALVGVEGPDGTFKLPSQVDSVLARIAAARRPALLNEVRALRRQLSTRPRRLALADGHTIALGEWDLQHWIAESLDTGREIAAMIEGVSAMMGGDFVALARASLASRAPRPLNLTNLAMDCASYASPERLARIRSEAQTALLGNAINEPKMEVRDSPCCRTSAATSAHRCSQRSRRCWRRGASTGERPCRTRGSSRGGCRMPRCW